MQISGHEEVGFVVETMPFAELEYLRIHVLEGGTLERLDEVLADCVKSRISGPTLDDMLGCKEVAVSAVARFRNLRELGMIFTGLGRGDVSRILAGREGPERSVLSETDIRTGVGLENARAITAIGSLREVIISRCWICIESLEALVRNRTFVGRLERPQIRARMSARWLERTGARVNALGLLCENKGTELDTGTIRIAVDR